MVCFSKVSLVLVSSAPFVLVWVAFGFDTFCLAFVASGCFQLVSASFCEFGLILGATSGSFLS